MRKNKSMAIVNDPLDIAFSQRSLGGALNEFNKLMDILWGRLDVGSFMEMQPKTKFPKVNVSESDTQYTVEIAVAGYDKDEVKLEFKDNCLFIKADKVEDEEQKNKFLIREISKKSFRRVIQFPIKIDTEKISGAYDRGVITCEIGKLIVAENQPIEIKIN